MKINDLHNYEKEDYYVININNHQFVIVSALN